MSTWEWLVDNASRIASLGITHLALSIPAIIASVIIAVPCGYLAFRRPRLGAPLLGVVSLLYAIPALPLLVFVPVFFGVPLRSSATMIIALTIYGVALLARTAAEAFASVNTRTRDAALALGYGRHGMFWKVDLPLAIPVLVAGVRVVSVSTVSLVTIGALVGIPSLGSLLTDGFQRGITVQVVAGLAATALLALLLDAALLCLGKVATPWTRRRSKPSRDAQEVSA